MLQHHRKIDCIVRVVTPENIEFEYMIAGPFQRLPAFAIDFALRWAVGGMLVFIAAIIGVPLGNPGPLIFVAIFLAFFTLSWFYGIFMETRFNGRTVGKMVCSLRVISADGRPINASQAALRNLLRLCDLAPPLTLTLLIPSAPAVDLLPTCLVGLIAMTLTTRMQRVGDLAANTMVVWEGRRGYNTNLQPDDPKAYALAELIPPTFTVSRTLARATALYMERRAFLAPQRREELAGHLSRPLLPLFQMRPDTSADLLLCAIYVRIYQSEEQRLAKVDAAKRKGLLPAGSAASSALINPRTSMASASTRAQPSLKQPETQPMTTKIAPTVAAGPDDIVTANVITAEVLPVDIARTELDAADIIPAAIVPTADQGNVQPGGPR